MKEISIAPSSSGRLNAFLKGMGQDASGELYLLVTNSLGPSGTTGKIYKIMP
jgi:hypothetical protein